MIAQLFDITFRTTQDLCHRFDTMRGQNLNLFYELYHVMVRQTYCVSWQM